MDPPVIPPNNEGMAQIIDRLFESELEEATRIGASPDEAVRC